MKLHRKHIALFGVPVLVLMLLCAFTFWLGWTQSGLRWVASQVQPLIGDNVSYKSLQGQLAGPLQIEGLQVETAALTLELETAQLDWSPWRLLAGHLFISNLDAQGLTLRIKPGDDDTSNEPFQLPERISLPLKVTVQQAQLDNAVVRVPGSTEALRIDSVEVAGSISSRELTLQHLSIQGEGVSVQGQATLATTLPYTGEIQLQGHWEWPFLERPLPPLDATLTATGTVQDLDVALNVRGPARLAIRGHINDLFDNPQWRANLTLTGLQPAQFITDAPFNQNVTMETELALQGSFKKLIAKGRVVAHNTALEKISAQLELILTPEHLQITSLTLNSSAVPTQLQLEGQLAFNKLLEFKLSGQWQDLAWPPGKGDDTIISQQGKFSASGNQQAIDFAVNATLTKAGENNNLHLEGGVSFSQKPAFSIQANWQQVAVEINDQLLRSKQGQLLITGTPGDYQLNGELAVQYADLPTATVALRAQGGKTSLNVEQLTANWLQGKWQLQGKVDWAGALDWQGQLTLSGINPALLAGEKWQGNVSAQLKTSGNWSDTPQIELALVNLSGTLNNAPLAGHGMVQWQPQAHRVQLNNVLLSIGKNRLQANGDWGGGQSDLSWSIEAPELASVLPQASGSLHAQGRFVGTRQAPHIIMSARAHDVRWQDYALRQLQASADISLTDTAASYFQIDASGLQRPGLDVTGLTLQGRGTLNRHDITLNIKAEQSELMLTLHGGYRQQSWQGVLQQATFTPAGNDEWRLAEPADVTLSLEQARLEKACWQQGAASLCLAAHWSQKGSRGSNWQVTLDLKQLPLEALAPWLPAGLQYAGRFNGEAHVSGGASALLHGQLTLALQQGEISQTVGGEQITLLAFDTGRLRATLKNNRLMADLLFQLPQQGKLAATVKLNPVLNVAPDEQQLSGKLTVHTDNFSLVPVLIPEIGRFSGELDAEMTLGGTLAAPALNGELHFRNGTATLPLQGLVLENLHLNVSAQGNSLHLSGGAQSGPGALNWTLDLSRTAEGWQGNGSLTGERFQALNSAQAWVLVSPQLDLRIDNRKLYLTGSLKIPEADITPRNLSSTVQVSPDQIIVGDEEKSSARNWQLYAEVRTIFGDDVHFEGFGLTADIEGAVTAIERPGEPTIGQGELHLVNGQYAAYGTKLNITRGRLIYNSVPITQPALDVTAIREIGSVTVGASIRGTLEKPRLELFSTPPMPENQILSYLVLGRPVSEISSADQQRLGSAATSLGLAGGALLANSIGEKLGIENITIQSASDPASAALVLGKYLTPRLYVSYGIGLFEAVNTVHLRYQLSSKWTLEARSGQSNSADFFYTIETD